MSTGWKSAIMSVAACTTTDQVGSGSFALAQNELLVHRTKPIIACHNAARSSRK